MNLKELFTEDRGVSPVIGVILMVAITVILAAVIGAFVLQIGGDLGEAAPQASISVSDTDASANEIELRHGGGDNIEWGETRLVVEPDEDGDRLVWDSPDENESDPLSNSDVVFSTSDRVTIDTGGDADADEAILTLSDGGQVEVDGDEDSFGLDSDDRVTVTMIDKPSGEIIFERNFRV